MAAQALYLKYRPQTFEEVVAQEPVMRTLQNALRQGKIRHAYLLSGPRGTGKTTTARLLAKAVNCHAPEEQRPCNACPICLAVNEGRLLDLIEIDAASNRGIDEIRDIREKVGFRPNEGRFKVYVLDEAHMLTEPAFNALLKTLEEPPPHVIFILVTTDPHKIPATIASRCQRFDFRRIPLQAIVGRLALIAEQEGIDVEPAALELIAQQGTGAMRDAISLLDQLASYGDEITLAQVQMVLGTVATEATAKLVACLADGDVAGGLAWINRVVGDGADPRQFGREVVEYLRGLLLIREGAGTRLLNVTAEQASEMEALAERVPVERLLQAIRLFNEAATDLKSGLQAIPQLPLEMALVESVLAPGEADTAANPAGNQKPTVVVASPTRPTRSEPPVRRAGYSVRVAEAAEPALGTASAVNSPQVVASEGETQATPTRPPQATTQGLSLERVEGAWAEILQTVRRQNPAVEGALRSGCQAVEVNGDLVVVTFPYTFLQDKLGDAARKAQIQDAISEVLGARCRLELVLASTYTPRQQAASASGGVKEAEERQALDDEALGEIARWAQERGGEATVIQS